MRVAALYDIHGNMPALEAVLDEVGRAGIDRIVVGGDVLPGPMPRESLACLLALQVPVDFIYGNGDRAVLEQRRGEPQMSLPEQAREIISWTAQQLDSAEERMLGGWPATIRLRIDGIGDALFCHSTPRNDTEIFTRLTPEERLVPVFAGANADLVVCGHTHMPFDRRVGSIRVVNAGSVGMPFGPAGADWLLLGPGVEPRHTVYDLARAADRIRRTSYPQADDFATRNVLNPPSEADVLKAWVHAELK